MPIKRQLSFSSGEIAPILQERTTLERFQNGLATARNVMIRKTGAIMSRFGREFLVANTSDDVKVKIYVIPNTELYVEIAVDPDNNGSLTVRNFNGGNIADFNLTDADPTGYGYPLTYDNIDNLHFVGSKGYVFIFTGVGGDAYPLRLDHVNNELLYQNDIFIVPEPPISATGSGSGSTLYEVDYAVTNVVNGEESDYLELPSLPTYLPVDPGDENNLEINVAPNTNDITQYNEVRVYRRPAGGSAYGFIGRSTNIYDNGSGDIVAEFTDFGQEADFTNSTPFSITEEGLNSLSDVGQYKVATGAIYQQRLILGNLKDNDEEAILASRPAYLNNFYRDFPYSSDSALKFKAGTTGQARVLRIIDSDGLVVFTTAGVYVNTGVLSPTNNALTRRGRWVIDDKIPPLVIPGGLFFVDKTTNSVRQLVYSNDYGTYIANDQSIFSDHLFEERTIKSWAYQEGVIPILIVSFSDGTFATYTYDFEHQMRAWTRHDSKWPVEQVEGTGIADTTFFVMNKNGQRYIEKTVPRIVPADIKVSTPEWDKMKYSAFMDEMVSFNFKYNDSLSNGDVLTLTPVTPDTWDGNLTLDSGSSPLFTLTLQGGVSRFFNPVDGAYIDLTVVSKNSNTSIVVSPSEEFPQEYASGFNLYGVRKSLTGLDHLEGEEVCVMGDGNVVASPNNDFQDDSFPTLVVSGGSVELPEAYSFVHVGLPITADVKTLRVSTVEQRPVTIESMTLDKLYVKVFDSRGLFVANEFPENKIHEEDGSTVDGMQSLDEYEVPDNIPLIGNRAKPNSFERYEITTAGDYEGEGSVAIRQVDPFHFIIESIISDIEVFNRSN